MEPLIVRATLSSPLVTNGGFMTLDGLLGSVLFDRMLADAGDGADIEGVVDAAHAAIPLRCDDGLFFASAAMVDGPRGRQGFVANLRAVHDINTDVLTRDRAGKVTVSAKRRRQYGAVMNTYDTVTAPAIEWACTGHRAQIEALLGQVTFVGKRRASGFGEVVEWTVRPGELDGVIGFLGEPLRPVPVERFGALDGDTDSVRADAAWRPAYWALSNRAVCFVPSISR